MNYCGLMRSDIANGNGVRVTLWCSGCSVHCKGCQNPETWDFHAGSVFDEAVAEKIFEELEKPYVKGLTLSGGNPLEPENLQVILKLLVRMRERFGGTKDVWCYTGFELSAEDFQIPGVESKASKYAALTPALFLCDYVIDGPFIESQRDITLPFHGSANQRIIDVEKTVAAGKIVEWEGEKIP